MERAWSADATGGDNRLAGEISMVEYLGADLHYWVRLPSGTGDELAAAAMTRGVAIASGSGSGPEDRFLDHVRLCYPAPPELLTEAVDRLAAAWRSISGARTMLSV